MRYGVQAGYAHKARVMGLHSTLTGYDKMAKRVEKYAPELVQAAKALGMHPKQLQKELKKFKSQSKSI